MDPSGGSPSPTATMSGDMPGMNMPGMGSSPAVVKDRPLAPVLGTFGGGTAAVLLSAGLLRRKDLAGGNAKEAARAQRSGK